MYMHVIGNNNEIHRYIFTNHSVYISFITDASRKLWSTMLIVQTAYHLSKEKTYALFNLPKPIVFTCMLS